LEKKFKEFKGLKKVIIDIETGNFEFDYPTEKSLSMEAVVAQVKKAGYTPKNAKITRQDGNIESHSLASNSNTSNNNKKLSIQVSGNCVMCKARIEASILAIEGIESAFWNKETKELKFTTNHGITKEKIGKQLAKTGHDNEIQKANKEVYNSLPPCCSYRK